MGEEVAIVEPIKSSTPPKSEGTVGRESDAGYQVRYREICDRNLNEARKTLERFQSPGKKLARDRVSPQRVQYQQEEVRLWEEIGGLSFTKTPDGYAISGVIDQGTQQERKIDINSGVKLSDRNGGSNQFRERSLEVIVNGHEVSESEAQLLNFRYGLRMEEVYKEAVRNKK